MAIADMEPDLTPEERDICATVHRFAEEVMRPVGQQLDKLADPADVIAASSPLWGVFDKYREIGIDQLQWASADLSPAQQARLRCIISEEMGWGDVGLSISLGVSQFPRMMALLSGKPELMERFGDPEGIGCWPITEPDHGSDVVMMASADAPNLRAPNCVATRDGDHYVIKGQKSAWVSNGTIATAAALFCAVDNGDGVGGMGGFVVPLDEKGVSRGKPLDKIGQRALNQGEIFFDEVRIPADYMVTPPEGFGTGGDMILSQANGGMGSTFVGVAQSAFEMGRDYAKQREQGGAPIIQHQSVKARLFKMYRRVEAARGLNRRVIVLNTIGAPRLEMAISSKVTSTETAFEVASDAIQLHGGNGLSREYPIEKVMRDARAGMIEDGCNEVLGLMAAERL